MKVLLTGAHGQLGRAFQRAKPTKAELTATGSAELDIRDATAVFDMVTALRPNMIVNAAAYTAVDRAEAEEEAAFAVNAHGVNNLARAAELVDAKLVHVSTDFVFDGSGSTPYLPCSATGPLSVYGRSKLAGEQATGRDAIIVRTAWIYAAHGANFVRTMLRLMAERNEVKVVADQIGSPTYAPSLADAIWKLATKSPPGIYHYTDSGVASWYDFAVAIQEEALESGLLSRSVPILPITTDDYPTAAKRPRFSLLDKQSTFAELGMIAPHWRVNLRSMMKDISRNG